MSDPLAASRRVIMGRVGAPFGVRGWVRIISATEPTDAIFDYPLWQIGRRGEWQDWTVRHWQQSGSGFAAQLVADDTATGPQDREAAARLTNCEIAVPRGALPALHEDEYYWADLIGLDVITQNGKPLGEVASLFETGANDVMVVRQSGSEALLPFVQGSVVKAIDLDKGQIIVDWEPEL